MSRFLMLNELVEYVQCWKGHVLFFDLGCVSESCITTKDQQIPLETNRFLLGTNFKRLNLMIKQQIKQLYNWILVKLLLCNIAGRIILWKIILSICLILSKSLTCLFIAIICKYHWWDRIYRKWNRRFTRLLLLLFLLLYM